MAQTWDVSLDDWPGRYGGKGVWVAGVPDSGYPEGMIRAPLAFSGGNLSVSQDPSTDRRAITKPDQSGRIWARHGSATGTTPKIDIAVNAAAGDEYKLTFNIHDHYGSGQAQKIELFTPDGQALIEPGFTVSNFKSQPVFVTIPRVVGPVLARWTRTGGYVVLVSGVFLTAVDGPPPDILGPIATAEVGPDGRQLVLDFNEPVVIPEGSTDCGLSLKTTIDMPTSLLYQGSGDGGLTQTFAIVRGQPVSRNEVVVMTSRASQIADLAGNKMLDFADIEVSNLSTVPGPQWTEIMANTLAANLERGMKIDLSLKALLWPEG